MTTPDPSATHPAPQWKSSGQISGTLGPDLHGVSIGLADMLEDDDLPALGRKLQDRYTLALVRPVSGCDCYDQTGECYLELGEHMGEQRGASGTRLPVVY